MRCGIQNGHIAHASYKYMLAEGEIGIDAYAFVVETIKEEMDEWIDNCESFNDIYSDW